ncbi:MAG: chromosome partitioning ATPase, partial [Propionivibrio sp.]|nr:chromosome partitioning ATPase [Propionivibrio sp.]
MSLIEQAAQRLEQLRQAGVDIPSPSAETAETVSKPMVEQALPPVPPEELHPPAKQDEMMVLQSPEMVMSRRVELDLEMLSAAGIIRPDSPRSQLADEYRV